MPVGPISDFDIEAGAPAVVGPVPDFIVDSIPGSSVGPVPDFDVEAGAPASVGPLPDFIIDALPGVTQAAPLQHTATVLPTATQSAPIQNAVSSAPQTQSAPLQHQALVIPPPPAPPTAPTPLPAVLPSQTGLARATLRAAKARGTLQSRVEERLRIGRFTGPAYPLKSTIFGSMGPKTDIEVLFTSVVNILTTRKGTLPYDPPFGSEVPDLVFEPNDEITRALIQYFTDKDLGEQEPRINIEATRTDTDPQNSPNDVNVLVSWTIVGDPSGQLYGGPIGFRGV